MISILLCRMDLNLMTDSAIDYQTEALKMYKQALDDGVISLEEYQMAEKAISNDQMGIVLKCLQAQLHRVEMQLEFWLPV